MIIDDVYTYLTENIDTVELVEGTNFFKGFLPDSPANAVCIFDTGGAEPDADIPVSQPTFQVFIRHKSYETAHDIAGEIYTELNRLRNVELVTGENYFYFIRAMGLPGHLGRDKQGRDEFSVNFVGRIRE